MRNEFIKSFDGTEINVWIWDDVVSPIGVVQIFHGMSEHGKRYDEFARTLNAAGYIVYADDHRAHGLTCKDKLGTYQGNNLFFDTVKDEIYISSLLKNKYQLPLYIFGHSYGSFLAQAYISRCDLYDKVILCGSALMKHKLNIFIGKIIAQKGCVSKGKDKPAFDIAKISFGKFNKQVKTGSWLNTIPEEIEKYNRDSYSGFICSYKFYLDFFSSFKLIYAKKYVTQINKNKPIFIISGREDPIGKMGKSIRKLCSYYEKLGINQVSYKLYPYNRHEILNDASKNTVFQDVIEFLKK